MFENLLNPYLHRIRSLHILPILFILSKEA